MSSPEDMQARWLLRPLRRRAWQSSDEFLKVEFRRREGGLDLSPSAYATAAIPENVVRVLAEHAASIPLNPVGATVLDLASSFNSTASKTPGESRFSFTKDAHREIAFASEAELRQMAVVLFSDLRSRSHEVSKAMLREFIRERVTAVDPEWIGFFSVWGPQQQHFTHWQALVRPPSE